MHLFGPKALCGRLDNELERELIWHLVKESIILIGISYIIQDLTWEKGEWNGQ